MTCLPLQMPLCDTAVTGPWTVRLRKGQIGAGGCGFIDWNYFGVSDLSCLKAGGNLPSPKIFCPPAWRSVS